MTSPDYHEGNGCQKKTQISENHIRSIQGELTVIVGARSSGKFTLFRQLYASIEPKTEEFIVFGKSDLIDVLYERYSDFTIRDNIHNTIDPSKGHEALNAFISHVKQNPKTPRVVVFDQIDMELIKSPKLKPIMMNLRHYGITLYIIQQYPLSLGVIYTSLIDKVYFSTPSSVSVIKKLWDLYVNDHFGHYGLNFEKFVQIAKNLQIGTFIELSMSGYQKKFNYVTSDLQKIVVSVKNKKVNMPANYQTVTMSYEMVQLLKSQLRQVKSHCSQMLDTLENF